MSAQQLPIRRFLPALFCAGALMTGLPVMSVAQTNPGFSLIWGGDGPTSKQQLNYILEYGTPGHLNDRYRLQLGRQPVAIDGISILFPEYFDGEFNAERISLRESPKSKLFNLKKAKVIPVRSVSWDKDSKVVELIPESPIPAGTRAEVVFNNVKNPQSGGTYFINCRITSPGDVPLNRYLGTWVMSIFRN